MRSTWLVANASDLHVGFSHALSHSTPVMTMSGSLPDAFTPHLLSHLGTCNQDEAGEVDLVESEELLGHFPSGFEFEVREFGGPRVAAVEAVKHVLCLHPQDGVHVLLSSKTAAAQVFDSLCMDHDCRLVTGDSSSDDQASVAQQWSSGKFRVLVSTTVALVGNENSACKHVVVVGCLFNLLSTSSRHQEGFVRNREKMVPVSRFSFR